MEDSTRQPVRWAVHSGRDDVPSEIRNEGTRALVNWIGLPGSAWRYEAPGRAIAPFVEFSGLWQGDTGRL